MGTHPSMPYKLNITGGNASAASSKDNVSTGLSSANAKYPRTSALPGGFPVAKPTSSGCNLIAKREPRPMGAAPLNARVGQSSYAGNCSSSKSMNCGPCDESMSPNVPMERAISFPSRVMAPTTVASRLPAFTTSVCVSAPPAGAGDK